MAIVGQIGGTEPPYSLSMPILRARMARGCTAGHVDASFAASAAIFWPQCHELAPAMVHRSPLIFDELRDNMHPQLAPECTRVVEYEAGVPQNMGVH